MVCPVLGRRGTKAHRLVRRLRLELFRQRKVGDSVWGKSEIVNSAPRLDGGRIGLTWVVQTEAVSPRREVEKLGTDEVGAAALLKELLDVYFHNLSQLDGDLLKCDASLVLHHQPGDLENPCLVRRCLLVRQHSLEGVVCHDGRRRWWAGGVMLAERRKAFGVPRLSEGMDESSCGKKEWQKYRRNIWWGRGESDGRNAAHVP